MSIRNIGIIGVGGVGGYFGGKLCRLQVIDQGISVSFVARGEHLRAIRDVGLLLSTEDEGELVCHPALATDDFQQLPQLDLCLICVKEFDLAAVLGRLASIVRSDAILLPLLNGVDVYSRTRAVIKNGIVLPACVYVGTHIERPGKVTQKGGACQILFGPDPLRPDFAPQELSALLEIASVKCEWTPCIQTEIWKKFIFICAFGLVTAAHNRTVGEILADDRLQSDVREIMQEAVALATKLGIPLPTDVIATSLAKGHGFPFDAKTSFQRDYERLDRRDERDLFAGAIIRMADQLAVDVPRTRAIAAFLNDRKPALTSQ
jgi:2-dehydropantoate 2-reductase